MSESSIQQREPESFQDFAYRFQLAQGLPSDQKGIIFIGNTRAGKSTLALSMTGVQMKIVFDSGNLTYVNPIDSSFKEIVRNTHQSVTQKPNFYKSNPKHNKYAIVDMPGHADSSRFRELINFHYIRTMAANLKFVRFLLVITIQVRNQKAVLPESEIKMLNSFRIMFPGCSEYIRIIINRVQNLSVNEKIVRKCFKQTVSKSSIPEIRQYYGKIAQHEIYVIERPAYRKSYNNESRYEKLHYEDMNEKTKEICHDPQAQFMELKQNDYYSLNIFKEGDNENNLNFYEKLKDYVATIEKGLTRACKTFQTIVERLIQSVIDNKQCENLLYSDVDQFLKAFSIETPCKKNLNIIQSESIGKLLPHSQILQLIKLISQDIDINLISNDPPTKKKQQHYKSVVFKFMSKILEIVQEKYHNGKLYENLMNFTLYFDRRITECYYIANVVNQQKMVDKEDLLSGAEMIIKNIKVFSNKVTEYCKKLAYYFVNLNIPVVFSHYQHHYHQLQKELLNNYHILQNLPNTTYQDQKVDMEIKSQIPMKIQELTSFVIIHSQPKEQEISTHIQKLLKSYPNSELQMKIQIIFKLAKLLQKQKQYQKNAFFLYLYLRLNDQAMRIFTQIEPNFKKQEAFHWANEVSKVFQENCMFSQAQRCLQIGKKWSIDDLDKFMELQKRILKLNDQVYTRSKTESQLQNNSKDRYWNWDRINQQIVTLRNKFSIKDNSSVKSLLLKNYR